MAKFRKKPVVIEAKQYVTRSDGSVPTIDGVCPGGKYYGGCDLFAFSHIHTLEGTMKVLEGDWIITGVQGEQYPCNPDIFEATYEPVEEKTHG